MNLQDIINNNVFINAVNRLFDARLRKKNLDKKPYHYGVVDSVTSSTLLQVFIDGLSTSQPVGCSPDDTFSIGDRVLILFVNSDSQDKIVIKNLG